MGWFLYLVLLLVLVPRKAVFALLDEASSTSSWSDSSSMVVTWPPNGSVLPPSFVVKAEILTSDHRAFIEANRHGRVCVGSGIDPVFCEDIFSAALHVANLTNGRHSMRAWIEGPTSRDVVVVSEPFEVEVSKEGPYYTPEVEEGGHDMQIMDDREGIGDGIKSAFSVDDYRERRRRSCHSSPSNVMTLMLGIKTSSTAALQRQTLRQTWLQNFSEGCAWFIVGLPSSSSPSSPSLAQEQALYGDLLLGDAIPVVDSYYHLVDKTTAFISWAVREHHFSYIMMLDDDVFLRADQVAHSLQDTAPKMRFYAGQVWWEQYGRLLRPQRNPKHRNYLSPLDYPMDELPPFAIGPHYILSHDLASYIARNRDMLRGVGTLEDVSIGLWLLALQVHPVNVPWFDNGRGPEGCQDGLVSLADLTPEGILHAHRNVRDGRPLCQGYSRKAWVKDASSLSGLDSNPSQSEQQEEEMDRHPKREEHREQQLRHLPGEAAEGEHREYGSSVVSMGFVKLLEPAMGSILPGDQPFELAVQVHGLSGAVKVGLFVDSSKEPVALWETDITEGIMRLEVEGLKEGSHVLSVALLGPNRDQEEDFTFVDVLPPAATTGIPGKTPLPILTDLHLRRPPQTPPSPYDRQGEAKVHVVLLSINLDANSQTTIFLTLAQYLPADRFTVSLVTAQPSSDPTITHQLVRAMVPIHYVHLSDPSSSSSLLHLLRSATPTTASNIVPSHLWPTIEWLGHFDIALTANTLDHPHTALLVEMARLASRPIRVLELPNIHPPKDLPIQAFTAPSLFAAQHPSIIASRHYQKEHQQLSQPPPIAVIFPPALNGDIFNGCSPTSGTSTAIARPYRVGFVARIAPDRSPGLLLHIAKQVLDQLGSQEEDKVEFLLIGGGPIEGQVKRFADLLLGVPRARERLRFVGHLDRLEVRCWYRDLDLLVNLKHEETFGIANAEAVAAGLPILGLDRGANRESIPSSHDHLLVPDGVHCTHAMAQEILRRMRARQVPSARRVIALPQSFKLGDFIDAYVNYFYYLVATFQLTSPSSTPPPPPPPPVSDAPVYPLLVGHSPMASYLIPVLHNLFSLAFPWAQVTVQALPPPSTTTTAVFPHIFVSSVLDGGCAHGYSEKCQNVTRGYAQQYQGALQVLWSGEAWDVLPLTSTHHVQLVVTASRPAPAYRKVQESEVPATIYIPVLSTCFGELGEANQVAVNELRRSLREVASDGKSQCRAVAYMYSRCDRPLREELVAQLEARGVEVAYLGACQGAGREELPERRWGRMAINWHDDAIHAYLEGCYGFVVAFENADAPGYVTEKILTAMLGQAIPIYWGPRDVSRIFNPRSFIDCSNSPRQQTGGGRLASMVDSCATLVDKVYRNTSLYESMAQEPRLTAEGALILRDLLSWHPAIDRADLMDGGLPGRFRQALWEQRQKVLPPIL